MRSKYNITRALATPLLRGYFMGISKDANDMPTRDLSLRKNIRNLIRHIKKSEYANKKQQLDFLKDLYTYVFVGDYVRVSSGQHNGKSGEIIEIKDNMSKIKLKSEEVIEVDTSTTKVRLLR